MAGPDQTGWVAEFKAQAGELGIAHRISGLGMLQGNDRWGAFYAAEVFCLPPHQENFCIVVAEALACGKPVLISYMVNIWRVIESDAAGFLDDDGFVNTAQNLQHWLLGFMGKWLRGTASVLNVGFTFGGRRSAWWRLFWSMCSDHSGQ